MPAPKLLVPRPGFVVSERLCALLNASHEGNVAAAAQAIGCNRDALWRAATGRSRGANLDMLQAVARYYATTVEALIV